MAGKKLFLIDAMSLVFRAFHVRLGITMRGQSGLPTQAIFIFVRTLRSLLREHKPDYVAVAFDTSAPTFRDELFEQYKANRPPFPEEVAVQLPYVRKFCTDMGLRVVERDGYEADDVIGTLAKQGSKENLDVFIVSGDKDMFQLVDERVRLLKPSAGGGERETIYDPAKVKEELWDKVEPSQVVDWLALAGDKSDNIPGARPLPGRGAEQVEREKKQTFIGEKGAADLIGRFKTLENAFDNYEQVERQGYREALRDYRKEALLSRELATINTNVPLGVRIRDLEPSPPNSPELIGLFRELGFSTLLREFLQAAPAPLEAAVESEELTSRSALERWLKALDSAAGAPLSLALGVEGSEDFSGAISGFGLADGKRVATAAFPSPQELLDSLGALLGDAARPKTVHNSKLLRLLLGKEKIELAGVAGDTMLYSYLLDPLATSHELEDVVLRRQGRKISSSLGEAAERTRELAATFVPEIVHEGLKKLYEEIELPLASVLADMEAVGVRIDPRILERMSGEFEKELAGLTQEVYGLAGQPFDIDSPKQLGEILFEKLRLPGGKRLKKSGQYSTDASVLESLAERHELPRKIIEYRTRAKLKSTYIDALPKYLYPETGRLHTSFNQTVARTGRLSSSNPNLQNIPIGDEFGLRIRSAFVADPGAILISADYSQIELRVLAHLSEDPLLIEAFTRGEDIHARTAQEIFSVPPGLQTHEHRRMAKAINYGVIYGLSSFGLAGRTGTSKTEAQQYIDEYFRRYRKVKDYLDALVDEARSTGRVRTLFGRLRPIPEIKSQDVPSRNRAEREAMNTPLQGTAADLLKLAMVKVQTRLHKEKSRTRMILTVHDELVFEAPEAELEAARAIVKTEMEGVYPMRAPLKVDLGAGKNWKEAK